MKHEHYVPNLGEEPAGDARRDAVHIAVAPVIAGYRLSPGECVGPVYDGTQFGTCKKPIGIVDPFLTADVLPGQRFWLFLYPGTITGLRHVWSHPAFVTALPTPKLNSGERDERD